MNYPSNTKHGYLASETVHILSSLLLIFHAKRGPHGPTLHAFHKAVVLVDITIKKGKLTFNIQGVPPGHEHLNISTIKLYSSMTFI
jgi:hypothetical protein